MTDKPTIAIDIDDVTANTIDSVRLWANELSGASLVHLHYHTQDDYWDYYNSIWLRHGLADKLNFEIFLKLMETDQSEIIVSEGAFEAIQALKKKFNIIFMTSRPLPQKDETRKWLDRHIDKEIPLYVSANPAVGQNLQSKGEMCRELGVSLLIDDNIANCQSALEYDVDAVLFGFYGWNEQAPSNLKRCLNWHEVQEFLLNEQ